MHSPSIRGGVDKTKGCKCFANLETKLWRKIPTNALLKMKGNLNQIYPIPFLLLKKEILLMKVYLSIFFKFEPNFYTRKFIAIAAIATFTPGCKLSANLFFVLCYLGLAMCMQSFKTKRNNSAAIITP